MLQLVLEKVFIDREDNVDMTLAKPIDDKSPNPEPVSAEPASREHESLASVCREHSC